ncbi:MAG: hypothetical protein U0790_01075 [Isosphaeraceae bacterium]
MRFPNGYVARRKQTVIAESGYRGDVWAYKVGGNRTAEEGLRPMDTQPSCPRPWPETSFLASQATSCSTFAPGRGVPQDGPADRPSLPGIRALGLRLRVSPSVGWPTPTRKLVQE